MDTPPRCRPIPAWIGETAAAAGELRAILALHEHRVVDAEFSPDGRWLATASWDGTARIWDLQAFTADPQAILDELQADQAVRIRGASGESVP